MAALKRGEGKTKGSRGEELNVSKSSPLYPHSGAKADITEGRSWASSGLDARWATGLASARRRFVRIRTTGLRGVHLFLSDHPDRDERLS